MVLAAAILLSTGAGTALAQERGDPERFVSREEYEKLKAELEDVKKKLAEVAASREEEEPSALEEAVDDLEKQLKEVRYGAEAARPGTTRFLVTGYGSATFEDARDEPSNFRATLNPILLWKLNDRLFFESELEAEMGEGGHGEGVQVEYAHLTYVLHDLVTVGAGKFLAPFGTFAERLHPAWINKLPNAPAAFGHDGVGPTSLLGVQLRGGAALGATKLNYAAYLANGPELNFGDDEPEEAGMLHFEDGADENDDKAFGGRVGFLPVPELEVGVSGLRGEASPDGAEESADATLWAVDLAYTKESEALGGTFDVRAEWAASHVSRVTFDPDGAIGFGPLSFSNRRSGYYVQAAYRPSKSESALLKSMEAVVRYDVLDLPRGAPMGADARSWTVGLDYWVGQSTVVKLAYMWTDRNDPMGEARDSWALMVQLAMGF